MPNDGAMQAIVPRPFVATIGAAQPSSQNSATMRQPRRSAAAISLRRWFSTVCSPVLTRRYRATVFALHSRP
jgi:hypothetical protein